MPANKALQQTRHSLRSAAGPELKRWAPFKQLMSVFKNDGNIGYFYALDLRREHSNKIVDALQVYTTAEDY